jgi:hypothetical protein
MKTKATVSISSAMKDKPIAELTIHQELRIELDGFKYCIYIDHGTLCIRGYDEEGRGRHALAICPQYDNLISITGVRSTYNVTNAKD